MRTFKVKSNWLFTYLKPRFIYKLSWASNKSDLLGNWIIYNVRNVMINLNYNLRIILGYPDWFYTLQVLIFTEFFTGNQILYSWYL